jgi:hypothetical protein
MNDPTVFFMGPKGVGKSAILQMVRLEKARDVKRIINLSPDDLAFSAFANLKIESPMLNDVLRGQWLFKSLWDYILLMALWERENEKDQNLFEKFRALFTKTEDEKRIDRLFQITISDQGKVTTLTDRILELIKEIELSAHLDKGGQVTGKLKIESKEQGQFRLLSEIHHAAAKLPSILKHEYFVLIDDLDLHWQNEMNQNAFIAALFLSLRKLSRRPVKFIVSIREDIYKCLPLADKDKSRDRLSKVEWDLPSIKEMIEKRITHAINCSPTEVWGNIFPENGFEQLCKFSTKKPREFIRLASLCMNRAYRNGHKRVLESDVTEAIREYSTERLQDLESDYRFIYKGLSVVLEKFKGKEKQFSFEVIDNMATELALEALDRQDAPWYWAGSYDRRAEDFAALLAEIGFLQVKENRTAPPQQYDPSKTGNINSKTWFAVHPMYAPSLDLIGR